MFRYRKSVALSYDQQGYIYFTSKKYRWLTGEQQAAIRRLCQEVSEPHQLALLDFMTTEATAEDVCMRHHIAATTLHRMVRRYYLRFPKRL